MTEPAAAEVVWAYSFLALTAGGCLFWVLPVDRRAALRGVAAGMGLAVWLAALWWIHIGVS